MNLSTTDEGILRELIYPVQFEKHPVDGVNRVIDLIRKGNVLRPISPADMLAAIQHGLASDAALAELLPQSHTEDAIRGYLGELLRRLQDEST